MPRLDTNQPWDVTGNLDAEKPMSVAVGLAYDDQSTNPFLHTYHPDHDNKDAEFKQVLTRGVESYEIVRHLSFKPSSPGEDFDSVTQGGSQVSGTYEEIMELRSQGGESKTFECHGVFVINRMVETGSLVTQ